MHLPLALKASAIMSLVQIMSGTIVLGMLLADNHTQSPVSNETPAAIFLVSGATFVFLFVPNILFLLAGFITYRKTIAKQQITYWLFVGAVVLFAMIYTLLIPPTSGI